MSNEHKDFLEAWDEATKPVVEKYNKTIVPVFRFGEQLVQAQLIVKDLNEVSPEPKTDESTDSGDKGTQS